ncbi:MAG: four helix bundle protein [Patescibacteria group bacterium]
MKITRIEDLEAWEEARKLCWMVYAIAKQLPNFEEYNIKKHFRESARGVAANIAEGFGRYFYKENLRFYGIARGCLYEVKSDLYICFDVNYIDQEELKKCLAQIDKAETKLNGLISNVLGRLND